jgi:hypothetical protein
MRYQLRSYTVLPGRMEAFLEVWRNGVVPLRERFGFQVVAAWLGADDDRFVWVVAHDDDFEAAERAYYAAPERAALDPDPGQLLAHAETTFVRSVTP